jgi:hypothetical protein
MTTQQDGLFPEPAAVLSAAPQSKPPVLPLPERQRAAIAQGQHPMSIPMRESLALHLAAERVTGPDQPNGGPTCGTCTHRMVMGHHDRGYAKCPRTRMSHGSATDVRAWWPACTRWEAAS